MTKQIITQRNKNLIFDALAIEAEEAKEAGQIGYMARALTLATIPHRDPKTETFRRENGLFRVAIWSDYGLPYGSYPRLILSWLTTEAVLTRSREIDLGDSLSAFMRELGLNTDGRSMRLLKEQTARLFSSAISCTYTGDDRFQANMLTIADKIDIWWHPTQAEQVSIQNSTVKLSKLFYRELINSPVPIDLRALRALKKSPMALDIYTWLTYRMSYLNRDTAITWEQLQMQLGAGYEFSPQGRNNFQRAFTKHLKSVLTIYPDARVDQERGRLILEPSPTHVPKLPPK